MLQAALGLPGLDYVLFVLSVEVPELLSVVFEVLEDSEAALVSLAAALPLPLPASERRLQ